MPPIKNVLKDTHLIINDINEVILVGGFSRIPKIKKWLKNFLVRKFSVKN